ncbi:conserved hypothetical protein [Paecilomyces variotii No. 5]|uniref:DUF3533 domain-containing protein n=1 Tax=Byssochlamys spectabilis (strain No. 5 / NBRC 109023) TaxID=1356009 RepID=V5FUJ0_BYSSN|nr:conserved hypothetical protein [Paecilomyces variotii No. 5]
MTVAKETTKDGPEEAPKPVPFWSPHLKGVRAQVTQKWAQTIVFLCVFVVGILSLYWAILFRVENNLPALKIWVVDFDVVISVATQIIQSTTRRLGFTIKSPADFGNDPMAVRQSVYDEKAYAAIIVNANATTLLREAVLQGNTSYDPSGAAQVITISARDQTTYPTYISTPLFEFQFSVLTAFGQQWASELANNASLDLSRVPQAVNPGIGFTNIDLRPFIPPVATPAVTIGLIYLIVISFFSFPFRMPIHSKYINHRYPLRLSHLMIWRILSTMAAYFFLSLCYSIVSLAYLIPFSNCPASDTEPASNSNAYGKGSFVVFWMLNWMGMSALGLPSENMGMILGPPWNALWLIFWIITNVSTGFYSLDLAPGFFAWGYAWPLHRIVEGSRTILFDTHSRIGLDFGILFAWVGISIALFPFAAMFMRWKKKKGMA